MGHPIQDDNKLDYTSTMVISLLENGGYFTDSHEAWESMKLKDRKGLITRHVKHIIPVWRSNNFGMLQTGIMNEEKDEDSMERPSSLYIVASLINHSCWRNVFHMFDGDRIQFRTIRDISKGEELLTNYGAFYGFYEPTSFRRDWLKERFKFICQCRCCSGEDKDLVLLEAQMQAFSCHKCPGSMPAWPRGFFSSESSLCYQKQQALIGEPLSVLDWLGGEMIKKESRKENQKSISVFCSSGHETLLDEETVNRLCGLKSEFYNLRGQLNLNLPVTASAIEEVYLFTQEHLHEMSTDTMMLRDIYIDLISQVGEVQRALTAMNKSREMMRRCFTKNAIEYEYELRAHLKKCLDMKIDPTSTELTSLAQEQAELAIKINARNNYRIIVGKENLSLFDEAVKNMNNEKT